MNTPTPAQIKTRRAYWFARGHHMCVLMRTSRGWLQTCYRRQARQIMAQLAAEVKL